MRFCIDHQAYLDQAYLNLLPARIHGPVWIALTVDLTTLMASTEFFAHINSNHRHIFLLNKPIWLNGPHAQFIRFDLAERSTINFELSVMTNGISLELVAWIEDLEGTTIASLKSRSRLTTGRVDLGPGRYYLFTKAGNSSIFPFRVARTAWREAP